MAPFSSAKEMSSFAAGMIFQGGLFILTGKAADAVETITSESGSIFRARPRSRPSTTSQVLGTPRRHEPRPPLARPRQDGGSARAVGSRVRLVYRGLRHARLEGGE